MLEFFLPKVNERYSLADWGSFCYAAKLTIQQISGGTVNLRIPGPTPVPDDILSAGARQMIDHRGPEFHSVLSSVTEGLKTVFGTTGDLLILTGSGTSAMEAAVVNTLSTGDKVLGVTIGVFGNRFADIASVYGVDVQRLNYDFGKAASADDILAILSNDSDIKAVLVTHNETSTGVTNDIEAIAKVVKQDPNRLLLIDAVSSLGSIPCPVDELQADVVISGSQKGWMVPPGLAMVAMSNRAWQAYEQSNIPKFYLDLGKAKEYLLRGQTPWTPAVSIFYGLEASLNKILGEGIENVYARHQALADKTRRAVKALGLELLADESVASNTVTAVKLPEGIDGRQLTKHIRESYDVVLGGGQGSLTGKIVRIAHLGYVEPAEIDDALSALERGLIDLSSAVS